MTKASCEYLGSDLDAAVEDSDWAETVKGVFKAQATNNERRRNTLRILFIVRPVALVAQGAGRSDPGRPSLFWLLHKCDPSSHFFVQQPQNRSKLCDR